MEFPWTTADNAFANADTSGLLGKDLESVPRDEHLLDSASDHLPTFDTELRHTPSPLPYPVGAGDILEMLSKSGGPEMQCPDGPLMSDLHWLLYDDDEILSSPHTSSVPAAIPENLYSVEDEVLITDELDTVDLLL